MDITRSEAYGRKGSILEQVHYAFNIGKIDAGFVINSIRNQYPYRVCYYNKYHKTTHETYPGIRFSPDMVETVMIFGKRF